mmetsp:Transcript_48858/g.121228  ORF Transcript_48858/g.121228 Transcript_48858/m.121228 type:complete len:206 (-) Transcript_48858:74-691(-)
MLASPAGRLIVFSEMQYRKAYPPMLVTPAGSSIFVSIVQAKAYSGTLNPSPSPYRAACAASSSAHGRSPSPRTHSRTSANECVRCRLRTASTSTWKGAACIRVMVGNCLSASTTRWRPSPVLKRNGFRSMSVGPSLIPGEKHREQSACLTIARQLRLMLSSLRSPLTRIVMSSSASSHSRSSIVCSINWSAYSTTFTNSGASEAA